MHQDAEVALEEARAAYERGDFRTVRKKYRALRGVSDPAIARQIDELYRRTTPDPMQVVVIIGCFLFFCWIVWRYAL